MVYQVKTARLIGIAGICRGTGATHLTLLTANSLASWAQRRTAVLEWNSHGDIARMEELMAPGMTRTQSARKTDMAFCGGYSLLEVDYYKGGSPKILANCIGENYDDIIIDFGRMRREIREEWLRCGTKIVTASLSEWKLEAFVEFLEGETKLDSRWRYAAAFGSEATRKKVERRFGISIKRIPFSADVFSVDHRVKDWLERILK